MQPLPGQGLEPEGHTGCTGGFTHKVGPKVAAKRSPQLMPPSFFAQTVSTALPPLMYSPWIRPSSGTVRSTRVPAPLPIRIWLATGKGRSHSMLKAPQRGVLAGDTRQPVGAAGAGGSGGGGGGVVPKG